MADRGVAAIPVAGDYDGDGRTDPAVYQPSTGEWIILQSSTDYTTSVTIIIGLSTDIPVPADYDGDGITDAAVFQPSTGRWIVQQSSHPSGAVVVATLGNKADIPVAADYDGDGKADLAVFHSGGWLILHSSANLMSGLSVSWFDDADVPLPSRPVEP